MNETFKFEVPQLVTGGARVIFDTVGVAAFETMGACGFVEIYNVAVPLSSTDVVTGEALHWAMSKNPGRIHNITVAVALKNQRCVIVTTAGIGSPEKKECGVFTREVPLSELLDALSEVTKLKLTRIEC